MTLLCDHGCSVILPSSREGLRGPRVYARAWATTARTAMTTRPTVTPVVCGKLRKTLVMATSWCGDVVEGIVETTFESTGEAVTGV